MKLIGRKKGDDSKRKRGYYADHIARINSRLLESYTGQTIRLTAKVIKLNGETATVEASDGGQVSLVSIFSLLSFSTSSLIIFCIILFFDSPSCHHSLNHLQALISGWSSFKSGTLSQTSLSIISCPHFVTT